MLLNRSIISHEHISSHLQNKYNTPFETNIIFIDQWLFLLPNVSESNIFCDEVTYPPSIAYAVAGMSSSKVYVYDTLYVVDEELILSYILWIRKFELPRTFE